MKKIFTFALACVMIVTTFIGCSKGSEAVNGTTNETETALDNLVEDAEIENAVTVVNDENETYIVGKDTEGNAVEIKTDKDGTVTKTVTDKNTGKKTTETTKVTTTKSVTTKQSTTTTKSKSETTTKAKTQTTTKQSTTAKQTTTKQQTTAKSTTAHTHNWQAVYKTRQVLVSKEPIYQTVTDYEEYLACANCDFRVTTANRRERDMHILETGHTAKREHEKVAIGSHKEITGYNEVYKDEKYIASYKCSCGATKSA